MPASPYPVFAPTLLVPGLDSDLPEVANCHEGCGDGEDCEHDCARGLRPSQGVAAQPASIELDAICQADWEREQEERVLMPGFDHVAAQ
jgi:hypothetical protein